MWSTIDALTGRKKLSSLHLCGSIPRERRNQLRDYHGVMNVSFDRFFSNHCCRPRMSFSLRKSSVQSQTLYSNSKTSKITCLNRFSLDKYAATVPNSPDKLTGVGCEDCFLHEAQIWTLLKRETLLRQLDALIQALWGLLSLLRGLTGSQTTSFAQCCKYPHLLH